MIHCSRHVCGTSSSLSGLFAQNRVILYRCPVYRRAPALFAFAGIWTARKLGSAWEKSFAIVTAPASDVLERIHDRMPLVLHPRVYAEWINPDTAEPGTLLQPLTTGEVEAYPISTAVNDPKNDSAECFARSGYA